MKWVLLISATLVLTGCEINDTGCESDADCLSPRTCQEGFCVGSTGITNNQNNANNQNNQNNENNENNANNQNNENNENNQNNLNNQECRDDCGPGEVCVDGECERHECQSNRDCSPDDACSVQDDGVNECVGIEPCFLVEQGVEPGEFCLYGWVCEGPQGGDVFLECFAVDNETFSCQCYNGDREESVEVLSADTCFDLEFIESLVNVTCGSAIRYTGFIDG